MPRLVCSAFYDTVGQKICYDCLHALIYGTGKACQTKLMYCILTKCARMVSKHHTPRIPITISFSHASAARSQTAFVSFFTSMSCLLCWEHAAEHAYLQICAIFVGAVSLYWGFLSSLPAIIQQVRDKEEDIRWYITQNGFILNGTRN